MAPIVPLAVAALVITGIGGLMVKRRKAVPVPPVLVAPMIAVDVPDAVGVPEITPVEVLTLSPDGSGKA